MESPTAPKPRPRWPVVALLVVLAFAGGVVVGPRVARDVVTPPPAAEPEGPRVAAKLFIPARPFGLLPRDPASESLAPAALNRETQAEWVRSRVVLSAALRPPEVARLGVVRAHADPIDWLAAALRVDFPSPEVMRVGLDGDDTEGLRVLLGAVVNAYLERVTSKVTTERAERLRRLNEIAAEWGDALRRKKDALARLRGEGEAAAQSLLDCRRELRRVRLALAAEESGKGDPAREKLLRQEEHLLREEKALDAQGKRGSSSASESASLGVEIDAAEQSLRRLTTQIMTLKVEQDAPAPVELMEAATVRAAK
jgi:hypothetical protein